MENSFLSCGSASIYNPSLHVDEQDVDLFVGEKIYQEKTINNYSVDELLLALQTKLNNGNSN